MVYPFWQYQIAAGQSDSLLSQQWTGEMHITWAKLWGVESATPCLFYFALRVQAERGIGLATGVTRNFD